MNHKNATMPIGARLSPTNTEARLPESAYHARFSFDDPTPGWRSSRHTESESAAAAQIPASAAASTDESARRTRSTALTLTGTPVDCPLRRVLAFPGRPEGPGETDLFALECPLRTLKGKRIAASPVRRVSD